MNIYELMEQLYTKYAYLSAGGDDAATWPFTPIRELFEAYYALVPPIDLWPADAQWFTIDANGGAAWHNSEPEIDFYWSEWVSMGVEAGDYHLEPGIDWRLCKWPRPENERLQSEPHPEH